MDRAESLLLDAGDLEFALAFLAVDETAYIPAVVLPVDGGLSR